MHGRESKSKRNGRFKHFLNRQKRESRGFTTNNIHHQHSSSTFIIIIIIIIIINYNKE